MREFKADLHCHSNCSDGTLSPSEIIQLAKSIGLQGLSITDHDTVAAYNDPAVVSSEELTIITGVEFSCSVNGESIHVLGYGFDPKHPMILDLCSRHTLRRKERNMEILELLKKHEMPLTLEDVGREEGYNVGRPHIALAMVRKGYVPSVQVAFKKYLGEGCSCYAPGKTFSVETTLDIIHIAGGIGVIAHPHLIKKGPIISRLLELEFDGIECIYGNFTSKDNARWLKIAAHKELLVTGGSDFHGEVKPAIALGASYIDKATFDKILEAT